MPDLTAAGAAQRLALEDDASLVEEAQRNLQAFSCLYDRYVQSVYRYVNSCLRDPCDAEEVTAQTFLTAFEAFPRYHHKGYFAAWLFSIARSRLVDCVRREHRQIPLEDLDLPVAVDDPLQHMVHSERVTVLRTRLASLTEEERELLRLRFAADLRFADIARLLGQSEDAVKKSLYRLIARLQHQMEVSHE